MEDLPAPQSINFVEEPFNKNNCSIIDKGFDEAGLNQTLKKNGKKDQ